MKTAEEQMGFYAAFHQDRRNRATHFVGEPAIMLSVFIPLAWLRLPLGGAEFTGAMLVAVVWALYYFMLDVPLAIAMSVLLAAMVWIGDMIARQGYIIGWVWFGVLFVGGWILQIVGHVFEGRKPAFTSNPVQLFIGPIFLCAKVYFALGYKPALQTAVQEHALRLRAGS